MREVILFNSRDELLRMKVDKIVYFQADGNYTHIVAKNKLKSTLGASLTKTEEILTAQLGEKAKIFRICPQHRKRRRNRQATTDRRQTELYIWREE